MLVCWTWLGVPSQCHMQWHGIGSLTLATVGLFTARKLASATIKTFSLQSGLLNIYQHRAVPGFTNDTGVNATSIACTALACILGQLALPETLCPSNFNKNRFISNLAGGGGLLLSAGVLCSGIPSEDR